MGFPSRAKVPLPPLFARIELHFAQSGDRDQVVEAGVVSCSDGEPSMVPHLPAAYFDKILSNTGRGGEGSYLLLRAREFWQYARAGWPEKPERVLARRFPLLDEHPSEPDIVIDVEVLGAFDTERIGATTKFKPLKAANPKVAELGLWAVWDWTVQALPSVEDVEAVLDNLLIQCDYYESNGLPRLRDIGKAPFIAESMGNAIRLRDELGATVGISGEEFMELSKEDRDAVIDANTRRRIEYTWENPRYREHQAQLIEKWNELWTSDANTLIRDDSGQPNTIESAIIKYASKAASFAHTMKANQREIPVDVETSSREVGIACLLMDGGYLWREAELQQAASSYAPLERINSAVEATRKNPPDEDVRSEYLVRAVGVAMGQSRNEGKAFDVGWITRDEFGSAVFEDAFLPIFDLVCEMEDASLQDMLLNALDFRRFFIAGAALREIEPSFPPSAA